CSASPASPVRAEVRPRRAASAGELPLRSRERRSPLGAEGPRPGETMAKWLNKYFSLGNNKTKSPPQPPRPDYREKRNGAGGASDLLRAYRAQKDRDFEDPYSGPGSSLERRPATPPDVKYVSPKHRLIKVEGVGGSDGKKLNKGSEQLATSVLIADDYSDPFDAKSELNRMGKGENTGYMEPYEAQRIMTGSKHELKWELYDIPYEPEGSAVESDSESVVSHHLRESKLPQDDDRPADEYDQPWEWNKVTIPALAADLLSPISALSSC
uniref:Src homology 2 domain containing E n=1 Tax=Falco tinnunculus TaxID=100819 RepID=A0A8C4TU45_FALTI